MHKTFYFHTEAEAKAEFATLERLGWINVWMDGDSRSGYRVGGFKRLLGNPQVVR